MTQYQNGHSYIPLHSDNEISIVPGSNIYCISIGAERTLTMTPYNGSHEPIDYALKDRSVYCMTALSQSVWKHGIFSDPRVKDPRISFTFMWLLPPLPQPAHAPHAPNVIVEQSNITPSTTASLIPPIHNPGGMNSKKIKILFFY